MSFFTRADIPNYWSYADNFVLQDRMFESVDSYTLPSHLYLMSGWAASCTDPHDPMSCKSDAQVSGTGPYPWTDITYLLHEAGVSWAYYVGDGTNLDCAWPCAPTDRQTYSTTLMDPVQGFITVQQNDQIGNVQHTSDYFSAAATGGLPSVSWVIPPMNASEHPAWRFHRSLKPGHAYVTGLRPAGAGLGHQPLCQDGVHRQSDPFVRCVSQVHRGPLPRRPAARSRYRWTPGLENGRSRERRSLAT